MILICSKPHLNEQFISFLPTKVLKITAFLSSFGALMIQNDFILNAAWRGPYRV